MVFKKILLAVQKNHKQRNDEAGALASLKKILQNEFRPKLIHKKDLSDRADELRRRKIRVTESVGVFTSALMRYGVQPEEFARLSEAASKNKKAFKRQEYAIFANAGISKLADVKGKQVKGSLVSILLAVEELYANGDASLINIRDAIDVAIDEILLMEN